MPDLRPESTRLPQNWTYLRLLKISFQFILARRAKMNWKLIFKSLRYVLYDARWVILNENCCLKLSKNVMFCDNRVHFWGQFWRPCAAISLEWSRIYVKSPRCFSHDVFPPFVLLFRPLRSDAPLQSINAASASVQ